MFTPDNKITRLNTNFTTAGSSMEQANKDNKSKRARVGGGKKGSEHKKKVGNFLEPAKKKDPVEI